MSGKPHVPVIWTWRLRQAIRLIVGNVNGCNGCSCRRHRACSTGKKRYSSVDSVLPVTSVSICTSVADCRSYGARLRNVSIPLISHSNVRVDPADP
jgi:hypothetical protein